MIADSRKRTITTTTLNRGDTPQFVICLMNFEDQNWYCHSQGVLVSIEKNFRFSLCSKGSLLDDTLEKQRRHDIVEIVVSGEYHEDESRGLSECCYERLPGAGNDQPCQEAREVEGWRRSVHSPAILKWHDVKIVCQDTRDY